MVCREKSCPGLEAASKILLRIKVKNFPRENEFINPTNICQVSFIFHIHKNYLCNECHNRGVRGIYLQRRWTWSGLPGGVFLSKWCYKTLGWGGLAGWRLWGNSTGKVLKFERMQNNSKESRKEGLFKEQGKSGEMEHMIEICWTHSISWPK